MYLVLTPDPGDVVVGAAAGAVAVQAKPRVAVHVQLADLANLRKLTERRGAAAVLLAALLPVLVIVAAFTINVAYIELLRVEHKVAIDAPTRTPPAVQVVSTAGP